NRCRNLKSAALAACIAHLRRIFADGKKSKLEERPMAKEKFIIEPHFRLQEWVAEEKGYFRQEGLDYVFQELIQSSDAAHHSQGDRVGAMQSFERGRSSDVS